VTGSLPQEVRDCFSQFITTEYTTIDARQQPIVWPVTPYYSDGEPCIDVSTGVGYPKKADDAKRNPHVGLLFSDPTGSGIDTGIQVLVQGTAEIDERDYDANADRYFRESGEKLPATKKMQPPAAIRRMLSWYYARIYVHVRPERVFVWADGDMTKPPEVHDARLEEVRSGHSEEPAEPHAEVAGGAARWDPRIDELGTRYPTAVLSWVGPDGFPLSVRLPVELDRERRRIVLGGEPAGLPLTTGRAVLVAHRHEEEFAWQENFQVRGDLVQDNGGWALIPHKLVGGFEIPKGFIARNRSIMSAHLRYRRTARERMRRAPS
jgi:Pyridoxamine 5'-phosphate oxidase